MTTPNEFAYSAHDAGECMSDCEHPDHWYDEGPLEICPDSYSALMLDALQLADTTEIIWDDE